jgi:plastocyanin
MLTLKKVMLFGLIIMSAATFAHAQQTATPLAQIIAIDECDPASFNAALGADFCKNVSLGAFTPLATLFKEAQTGHPDPKWDFEPDTLAVNEGTILNIANEGGEPHTFTEVDHFGGGFITQLNGAEAAPVPECAGGFGNLGVARTRILQGSSINVTNLSKGEHHFQCCIHPWMRVTVDVK